MKFDISNLTFFDLKTIEVIGKTCLPIYYKSTDLMFLIFNNNYLMYKISLNNEIVGFVVANKKYNNIDLINKSDPSTSADEEFNQNKTELVKRLHIMSIGVLPKYRKLGIATKLINQLKTYIKNTYKHDVKLSLFVLTNNIPAIKLYEKNKLKKIFKNNNYYETLPIKSAYYYET